MDFLEHAGRIPSTAKVLRIFKPPCWQPTGVLFLEGHGDSSVWQTGSDREPESP